MDTFAIIYCSCFAIALTIVCFFVVRYMDKGRQCTEKTYGTVVKHTLKGGGRHWACLVEYVVNGVTYRTWGPVYRAVVTVSVKTPLGGMQPEERYEVTEKGVLKQYISRNSFVSVRNTPTIADLYPVGSTQEVYYDKKKPKRAYAIRFYAGTGKIWMILTTIILDIVLIGLTVLFITGVLHY